MTKLAMSLKSMTSDSRSNMLLTVVVAKRKGQKKKKKVNDAWCNFVEQFGAQYKSPFYVCLGSGKTEL